MDEQQYAKGFNQAYLLARHEPELLEKLSQTLTPSSEYLEGFISGKQQYELEQEKTQLDDLEALRNSDQERENDLGPGLE